MESTASVNGHPIHPMLIPYPFALLSSAVAFDLGARLTGRLSGSQTARHLTSAGLGTALVAAVPGIVDYFGTVPPRTSARRTATRHALSNVSALACFAVAQAARRQDGRMPTGGMVLALLGAGLLAMGGWLGGQLVYHEHVGVADDRPDSRLGSRDGDAETAEVARAAAVPAGAETRAASRAASNPALINRPSRRENR
jgi:uncharacterized membrane protein